MLGLLTVIFGVNAVFMATMAELRGVALILGPLAVLFAVSFIAVGRYRARRANAAGERIATIDLERGLVDDRGELVAPVSALSVKRTFQMTSSSRALELRWPGGAVVIARGNPFAGDVGAIEDALRQQGVSSSG